MPSLAGREVTFSRTRRCSWPCWPREEPAYPGASSPVMPLPPLPLVCLTVTASEAFSPIFSSVVMVNLPLRALSSVFSVGVTRTVTLSLAMPLSGVTVYQSSFSGTSMLQS